MSREAKGVSKKRFVEMGINAWVFKKTKTRYPGTFQKEVPASLKQKRHATYEDIQYVIKAKPDYVTTLPGFFRYMMEIILKRMRNPECPSPHFTIFFDRKPPKIKQSTHEERNKGITGDIYEYDEDRPIIKEDADGVQEAMKPENWSRYTANRKLVMREFLPMIYNALLQDRYYVPLPGEQLFVHGLPIQWRYKKRIDHPSWLEDNPDVVYDEGIPELVPRARIKKNHERTDPDIYNRVFVISKRLIVPAVQQEQQHQQGYQPRWYTDRSEWKEAKSTFGEADFGIVYYWRFFRDSPFLVYMNDGDALPILLMHSYDRLVNGVFTQEMWLCKPRRGASGMEKRRRKRAQKQREKWTAEDEEDERKLQRKIDAYGGTKTWAQIEQQRPKRKFININKLYTDIMNDPELSGIVQNPVTFYVCAIIMSGTDFFPKNRSFLPGIGIEKKVWPTLFSRAAEFSHMFQSSLAVPSNPLVSRDIVVDTDAFVRFCELCYTLHASVRSNKNLMSVSRRHESLDNDKMRVYARLILHDALYKTNAYREDYSERYPDAHATDKDGLSLFGFAKETSGGGKGGCFADKVSQEYPFVVDEVFSRHFFALESAQKKRKTKK